MRIGNLLVLLACFALVSCASLSKTECLGQDWQTIGYKDGLQGFSENVLSLHTNACEKHGTVPNADAYAVGRRAGIEQFCAPNSAIRHGAGVKPYSGVCPSEMNAEFIKNYLVGLNSALDKASKKEVDLARNLKKIRNPRTFRYWARKTFGTYQDRKEDAKNAIATNQQEQSKIASLIEHWQLRYDAEITQ